MWSNFHTHSNYCDGKGELHEYVEKARELKMKSLGFSSHAPLPFPCTWCLERNDLSKYLDGVESMKRRYPEVEIYKSLEIDFVPGISSPEMYDNILDYTIGSIHFVEKFPDGTPWEIDGRHTLFMDGLESIFDGNIQDAITRYYELTREMVNTSCPTIVGHLDKIKIQNIDGKLFSEEDSWYQQQVIKTIEAIAQRGAIVEVNTRGLYQKKSATPYPSPWILALLREKNVPVTLNSDAHHPDDVINLFSETCKLLADIGFKSIIQLSEGTWNPVLINSHGIIC